VVHGPISANGSLPEPLALIGRRGPQVSDWESHRRMMAQATTYKHLILVLCRLSRVLCGEG